MAHAHGWVASSVSGSIAVDGGSVGSFDSSASNGRVIGSSDGLSMVCWVGAIKVLGALGTGCRVVLGINPAFSNSRVTWP